MDQRKRKDEFCKKVDKMIKGKEGKRPRKNSNNINANSVIMKNDFGSTSNNNANGVNSTSNSDGDIYNDNDIDGTTDNNKVVNSYQKIEGIRNLEIKC